MRYLRVGKIIIGLAVGTALLEAQQASLGLEVILEAVGLVLPPQQIMLQNNGTF